YLDGAELFDQNGGRMVINESTFGTAPYRFHKHSAILQPDGVWHMQGGYGGIVRTLFDEAPELEEDSVIFTNQVDQNTANIVPGTTQIKFPLVFVLSRFVSGRIVDGNIYFARNTDPATTPAISFEEVNIYMDHSTAAVDGLPVGTTIDADHNPGDFDSIVTLTNPAGTVDFDPLTGTSDASSDPAGLAITQFNLTFPPVYPTKSVTPNSPQSITAGSINATVAFTLPSIYRGVRGSVNFGGGSVTGPAGTYMISIDGAGNTTFFTANPTGTCPDPATGNCKFYAAVTIPTITGSLTNLQENTTIQTNADLSLAGLLSISYALDFTADEIRPGDLKPAFAYSRSNIVISSMIYSSALAYTPSANTWKDLSDIDVSPTLSVPVFDHTAVMTPAADTVIIGGRNCESSPDTACPARTFSPTAAASVFIPVYRSADGGDSATQGEKLSSPRAFHTSTMLLNGQVLTCGGSDGVRPLATCELLDPSTRKWTETGSMKYARTRHTATLLPNGNVLVAGGATPSSAAVNTAEIYYPASRSWVQTTPMYETRQNHTATLLPDGNVLVAGGATQSTYTVTTEIFISSNSYWMRGGDLQVARAQHTATLLRTGHVLMAGGVNGFGAVNQSEIVNYITKQSGSLATMSGGRYGHTANLLRDGRVILLGGSNNYISGYTGDMYSGGAWNNAGLLLTYSRAGHRSVLLPNGKLLVTGGEDAGTVRSFAEGFDPDWLAFTPQGTTAQRAYHTSVVTPENYILNIGGWDGANYLDTTDLLYFSYFPDVDGREADPVRNPLISTGTVLFDRGDRITLESGTTNFHGITEASGGGAGPMSSSHSNPRVYMQQIDNSSGYMIDMSTYIYAHYGGLYSTGTWESSLSSITVRTPLAPWDLPHGWYHVRVAANGQFSSGFTVQVTTPRPTGLASAPTASGIGKSSLTWTWTQGTLSSADGYSLYAASNSVFITTMAFVTPASYTQTGLSPNTQASVMVSAYNLG
ncbi:MAG: Kelch repeat-containing protein, partial [Elusimicrobiales bacterium]